MQYRSVTAEGWEPKINEIAQEQGYKNRDMIHCSKEGLGSAYGDKLRTFFEEHLHEDEEVRYILSGSGYFDIRETPSDAWIRLAVEPGDFLVLPAGIYHRFTLDEGDNLKAVRLFKDEPKWIPHNRSETTETNPHRIEYLRNIGISVGA